MASSFWKTPFSFAQLAGDILVGAVLQGRRLRAMLAHWPF
jgi:hypothetical protein